MGLNEEHWTDTGTWLELGRRLIDGLREPAARQASTVQAALIDELLEIMPSSLTRFAFQNSGSEAVENAVKIARAHTKRKGIIAFEVHLC